MSINLVSHLYGELEKVIRARDKSIPILKSFPMEKELPQRLFVIEHVSAEPQSVANGQVDLEMRWEIRFIKKISDDGASRHDVQDMAWKIGVLFHRAVLSCPYETEEGSGGYPIYFISTQDDNFDVESQSFESWVTELSITARVGPELFDEGSL